MTGAARRLGRALATALAREGYSIALHHRSSAAEATDAAREIAAAGVEAAIFRADFRDAGSSAALVREAVARFGRLDLLVHGASPFTPCEAADVTEASWDATFAAVSKAAFFLSQQAAPALRESGGSVVLLSDVAARQAWPTFVPHSAAKAAVEALVRNLAVALAPVRVNGIAPGVVLPPDDMPAEAVERIVARTPLKRRVPVGDVAAALLFLARTGSVTGHVLTVDGGLSAR